MVLKKLFKFLKKRKKIVKKSSVKKPKKKTVGRKKAVKELKTKKSKQSAKKTALKKEKLIGVSIHYFSKIKVGIFKMKGALKVNDNIHIKGHTTDFKQKVISMQVNHKPVKIAKKGQEVGFLIKKKVRNNDKVYKI